MDSEELYNVTLRCIDCDNTHCKYGRRYILPDSKEGCTRIVKEDLFIDYQIQLVEKWPFAKFLKTQEEQYECYEKTINVLEQIYNSPIGHKISDDGRITYKSLLDLE